MFWGSLGLLYGLTFHFLNPHVCYWLVPTGIRGFDLHSWDGAEGKNERERRWKARCWIGETQMSKALKDGIDDRTFKTGTWIYFNLRVSWNIISPLSMTSSSLVKYFTLTNAFGSELLVQTEDKAGCYVWFSELWTKHPWTWLLRSRDNLEHVNPLEISRSLRESFGMPPAWTVGLT